MNAREITTALKGDWCHTFGLVPGPGHSPKDRSLKLWDTQAGIRVHSFCGDPWDHCKDWLRAHGLIADDRQSGNAQMDMATLRHQQAAEDRDREARRELALEIWAESKAAIGTVVEIYLRGRGLTATLPPSLRFHPNLKHGPTGLFFPAMVGGVQGGDRSLIAIHRTFLLPDGSGKAGVASPKMALGSLGDGALRLGPAAETLGIAEGTETAMSASQLFGVTVWAALGPRLHAVWLDRNTVKRVVIFRDNGDAGARVADSARASLLERGFQVAIKAPPPSFPDWNDALQQKDQIT